MITSPTLKPGPSGPPGPSLPNDVYNKIMEQLAAAKAEDDRKWEAFDHRWNMLKRSIPYLWATSIVFAIISIISFLTSCAPVIWDRPMTTPDQFRVDSARCQLTANAITPSGYVRNLSDAVADGIVVGIDRAQNFGLCMEANGYQKRTTQ